MSWLDAANLRNRVYTLQDRVDTLEIALLDIERMTDDERIRKLIETKKIDKKKFAK
jgi:hypothetical protein